MSNINKEDKLKLLQIIANILLIPTIFTNTSLFKVYEKQNKKSIILSFPIVQSNNHYLEQDNLEIPPNICKICKKQLLTLPSCTV
jgi:hypothetical protein